MNEIIEYKNTINRIKRNAIAFHEVHSVELLYQLQLEDR